MRSLWRQTAALLVAAFREIPSAPGHAVVTVFGVACAVGVLVAMLSMSAGSRALGMSDVLPNRFVIRSTGAASIGSSDLPPKDLAAISSAPQIQRDSKDEPLAAGEAAVTIQVMPQRHHVLVNVPLYGVSRMFQTVYPELTIEEGSMYKEGLRELIVGRNLATRYRSFAVGSYVRLGGAPWRVVGVFAVHGLMDNVMLADLNTLTSALHRQNLQQIVGTLRSASLFDAFSRTLQSDPSLQVHPLTETEATNNDLKRLNDTLDFLSYFLGGLIACGATIGAMNITYSAVERRRRDLATVRAVGFRPFAVVAAVIAEILLLSLLGGAIGVLVVWLGFNGEFVSSLGMLFPLMLTPRIFAVATCWALVIGLISAVVPAITAATRPVAVEMRRE